MATTRRVPDHWLSRGIEVLLEEARGKTPPIDILIVGSGYGGSVAAARFAAMRDAVDGHPLRVVLLERGDEYVPGAFPDRFEQVVKMARLERTLEPDEPIDRGQSGLDQALFDVRMGKEVTAVVGNGLGGGSLINAGVVERPLPDVFADDVWPQPLRHPAGPGRQTGLDPFFSRVETMLGAGAFSPMLPKTQALIDDVAVLAAEAGAQPGLRAVKVAVTQGPQQPAPIAHTVLNAAGVLQAPCNLCGNCVTGCNYGAKNVLPMNYLALASRHGAEIYTGATVLAVRPVASADGWIVSLRRTHDRGDRDLPDALHELHARRVVLAAGTFGSPQILHQSMSVAAGGAALGHLQQGQGGWLGRGVSCNGDGIAAIHNQAGRSRDVGSSGADPKMAADGRAVAGPTATGIIDLRNRADSQRRFVIEDGVVPFPLMRLFEESVTTFSAVHAMAEWNRRGKDDLDDPLALDSTKMARSQFLLLMGHDDAGWRMDFVRSGSYAGQGRDRVQLSRVSLAPRRGDADFKAERERQHDLDTVVGGLARGVTGGRYIPNPLWEPAPQALLDALESEQDPPDGEKAASTLMAEGGITVHPLGGCRMADAASHGVVNHLGQVFRAAQGNAVHEGLVVLDGSIVPGSLAINPLLTIAALAERACEQLATCWQLEDAETPPRAAPQLPRPVAPLPWSPAPTAVHFGETITGGLQLTIDPVAWPSSGPVPEPRVRRDVEAILTARSTIDSLEQLVRNPTHTVTHASADLKLIWYVPPTANASSRMQGVKANAQMGTDSGQVHVAAFPLAAGRLLPSTREERVWNAMRHWLEARGRAFLHDRFDWIIVRRFVLLVLKLFLWVDDPALRKSLLDGLERFKLPGKLGELRDELIGLLKVASHHGEARVLSYDLGEIAPPAPGKGHWPFKGKVRIIGAKRLHYGMGPGYRQRPSVGVADRELPEDVPTQFWRSIHELQVLVLSKDEGEPITAKDWPADQWPQGLDPGEWRVVGRGTWRVNDVPLLTNDVPQLLHYRSLPDAWADLASLGAFLARCLVQTSFWRLRLPRYPLPLPDEPVPGDKRTTGPLPGQVLDKHANRYVDGSWNGKPLEPRVQLPKSLAVLTHFPAPGMAAGKAPPVLLIHAFVTSGYMFATPRVKCNAVEALTAAGFDTWVVDLRTSVALPCSHDPWDFDSVGSEDVPAAVRHVYETCGQPVHVVAQCMGSAVFNMAVLQGHLQHGDRSMVASSVQVQVSMDIVASLPNHVKAVALRGMQTMMDMDEVNVVADTRTLGDKHRFAAIVDRMLWMWPVNDVDAMRMADNRLCKKRQVEVPGIRRIIALYGRIFSWDDVPAAVRDNLPELFRHASMRAIEHLIRMERAGRLVDFDGTDRYVSDAAILQYYGFPVLFVHGQFATVFGQGTTRRSRIRLDRLRPEYRHARLVLPLREPGPKPPRKWGHFDLWVSDLAKAQFFPHLIDFLKNPNGNHHALPLALPPAPHWQYLLPAWQRLGRWTVGTTQGSASATLAFRNPFVECPKVDICVVAIDVVPGQAMPLAITTIVDWTAVAMYSGVGVIQAELDPAHQNSWICIVCRTQSVAYFSDPDYTHAGGGQDVWWADLGQRRVAFHAVPAGGHAGPLTPEIGTTPKFGIGPGITAVRAGASWALAASKGLAPVEPNLEVTLEQSRASKTHSLDCRDHPVNADAEIRKAYDETGSQAPGSLRLNARAFAQLARGDRLRFVMASCRYQASAAEKGRADRVLARTMRHKQDGGEALVETLDFALLLGDQIYADATYGVFDGRPSTERLRAKYAALWAGSAGALASRVPTWLCIDDHEIRDDWFDGLRASDDLDRNLKPRMARHAPAPAALPRLGVLDTERIQAAFDNQTRALLPPGSARRFWYDFQSCGFRIFTFDLRTERGAPGQQLFSSTQWAGFLAWLAESDAEIEAGRPLVLAMSTPLFPFVVDADTPEYRANGDGWVAYPADLRRLLEALLAARVRRLVLLAGDPHISHVAHGKLVANGQSIEICSIVSSGLNAPLPSENTPRGAMVPAWRGNVVVGGAPFGHLRYTTHQASDEDCAAVVDLQLATGDGSGADRWDVQVEFVGRDSQAMGALTAKVTL